MRAAPPRSVALSAEGVDDRTLPLFRAERDVAGVRNTLVDHCEELDRPLRHEGQVGIIAPGGLYTSAFGVERRDDGTHVLLSQALPRVRDITRSDPTTWYGFSADAARHAVTLDFLITPTHIIPSSLHASDVTIQDFAKHTFRGGQLHVDYRRKYRAPPCVQAELTGAIGASSVETGLGLLRLASAITTGELLRELGVPQLAEHLACGRVDGFTASDYDRPYGRWLWQRHKPSLAQRVTLQQVGSLVAGTPALGYEQLERCCDELNGGERRRRVA